MLERESKTLSVRIVYFDPLDYVFKKEIKMIKLINGDCLEQLKHLPDASVDSVVTDAPYELGFMNRTWDKSGIANNVELWSEVLRVLKPGGHLLAFSSTRTSHRMVSAIEDAGFEIRDTVMYVYGSGFPKNHDISKAIDKAAGAEREAVGTRDTRKGNGGTGNDFLAESSRSPVVNITAPTTDGAKQWEGWGTALKPAFEPICLARKPLSEKTIAANVLQHGTGGLNIDGCRVGTENLTYRPRLTKNTVLNDDGWKKIGSESEKKTSIGRWPANFIHDGLKESWAKYFYCAKATKQDRNEGCEALEEKQYSHDGREVAINNAYQRNASKSGNHHPTVKPTELMRYLIKLITPPQGLVLDPFMGSGSTGKAAALDGFSFIGIELDEEYVAIAEARINFALDSLADDGVLW